MLARLDKLAGSGDAESRTDSMRRAFEGALNRMQRHQIGESIAAAYRRVPETYEELEWAALSTRSMIAEEPW